MKANISKKLFFLLLAGTLGFSACKKTPDKIKPIVNADGSYKLLESRTNSNNTTIFITNIISKAVGTNIDYIFENEKKPIITLAEKIDKKTKKKTTYLISTEAFFRKSDFEDILRDYDAKIPNFSNFEKVLVSIDQDAFINRHNWGAIRVKDKKGKKSYFSEGRFYVVREHMALSENVLGEPHEVVGHLTKYDKDSNKPVERRIECFYHAGKNYSASMDAEKFEEIKNILFKEIKPTDDYDKFLKSMIKNGEEIIFDTVMGGYQISFMDSKRNKRIVVDKSKPPYKFFPD